MDVAYLSDARPYLDDLKMLLCLGHSNGMVVVGAVYIQCVRYPPVWRQQIQTIVRDDRGPWSLSGSWGVSE